MGRKEALRLAGTDRGRFTWDTSTLPSLSPSAPEGQHQVGGAGEPGPAGVCAQRGGHDHAI